jgi:hypothetical protein
MATFTLIAGLPANYYPVPPTTAPVPGDGFLLVERPLIDPKNMQPVGRLIARVTWMELPAGGNKLNFGHADHRLTHTKKKGVISVQGRGGTARKSPSLPSLVGPAPIAKHVERSLMTPGCRSSPTTWTKALWLAEDQQL